MIRPCIPDDFDTIHAIINDAAQAYRGVIPEDCCPEPYMPRAELQQAIADGVRFFGFDEGEKLIGVMGLQQVEDVTLIRHAYVRTACRSHGVGGRLLAYLRSQSASPVLVGTWAAALWAVRFYQKQGFELVGQEEKERLLRRYWGVPQRQIETSVVLADAAWRARRGKTSLQGDTSLVSRDAFARLLGLELAEVRPGYACVRMTVRPEHCNGLHIAHGGTLFTIADYAFAAACNAHGKPTVAVNASISFARAVAEGTHLTAEAREVSGGKLGQYEVRVMDEGGGVVAYFHGLSYEKRGSTPKGS